MADHEKQKAQQHGGAPIGSVLPSQVPQTEATFRQPGRGTLPKSIDLTKVAVVQGFPPDVTAADIRTYFKTFGTVTDVGFSKTTKIAKVTFSESRLVDVMVTMAATGLLTMGDEAVLSIEYGVDFERHFTARALPIKREREAVPTPPVAPAVATPTPTPSKAVAAMTTVELQAAFCGAGLEKFSDLERPGWAVKTTHVKKK